MTVPSSCASATSRSVRSWPDSALYSSNFAAALPGLQNSPSPLPVVVLSPGAAVVPLPPPLPHAATKRARVKKTANRRQCPARPLSFPSVISLLLMGFVPLPYLLGCPGLLICSQIEG